MPLDAIESLPTRHTSALRVLGPLAGVSGSPIEGETPLFAAGRDFARAEGGPLTRAFLDALPVEPDERLVIDSSLVWLAPGLVHGFALAGDGRLQRPRSEVRFFHEPFPGIDSGVRGASNRQRGVTHWLCVLGLPCTPEVAVGELAFASVAEAEAFWLPLESVEEREAELERRLATGALALVAIPPATLVEYGWGTLLRPRRAIEHGFQLILRATRGDPRPLVDERRNHAML